MAKYAITLEVDSTQLFDTLHQLQRAPEPGKSSTDALGARMAGLLLTPENTSLAEQVGLAAYGITVKSVSRAADSAEGPTRFRAVAGSQSGHCCFLFSVIDTGRPVVVGDQPVRDPETCEPMFEELCECFKEEDARRIADALNAATLGKTG